MLVFTVIPYFIDTLFTLSTFFFVRLKEYKVGDFKLYKYICNVIRI